MTSVAKNIKRLRTEKNMTQEALAQALNVTRQTVSSWENNRTQPDIDMLASLSETLGADIEELIYGRKRSVGLEPDNAGRKHLLSVVLTVFGSLFAAAGVVILFIWLWDEMPEIMKTVLAFLPALSGCAAGLYALFGKSRSVLKNEAAAVLWITGVTVTNALVNSFFSFGLDYYELLFADTLLILPVMFLLDSIAAYTAFSVFYTLCWFGGTEKFASPGGILFAGAVAAAEFAAAVLFIRKSDITRPLKNVAVYLAAASFVCNAFVFSEFVCRDVLPFAVLLACFICLAAADREDARSVYFRYPAVAGSFVIMFLGLTGVFRGRVETRFSAAEIIVCVFCVLLIGAGIYTGRKSFAGNIHKIIFISAVCAGFPVTLFYDRLCGNIVFAVLIALCGAVLISRGVTTVKLLPVNFGILVAGVDIFFVITNWIDVNTPLISAFCLAVGALLLFINRRMMKSAKKRSDEKGGESHA